MEKLNTPLTSKQAMSIAIEEAKKGFGYVAPNPPVGCVILDKDGLLLSKGYHTACGKPHAEIEALNAITDKSQLQGAHVFVTLEPCSFVGRTPACAETLAKLPIATVIYGMEDPHPKVSGRGAEILRQAGKVVAEYTELQNELNDLIEIFKHNIIHNQCFIAVKSATSLDGKIALKSGESKWITNNVAREYSHYLRAYYGAVGVGLGTYQIDNPLLNVRHPLFSNYVSQVVLFDPLGESFKTLNTSNIYKNHSPDKIFIVVNEGVQITDTYNVNVIKCPLNEKQRFNWDTLSKRLYENKVYSLYVEGGSFTLGEILNNKAAQKFHQFFAPSVIGGEEGVSWSQYVDVKRLKDKIEIKKSQIKEFGDNFLVTGQFK